MFYRLEAGNTYYAGLDKPALASWGDIADALRDEGVVLEQHFPRSRPPLPFEPRTFPAYSDDWDQVAILSVRRSQTAELPDRVAWVAHVPSGAPASATAVNPEQARGEASGRAASDAAAEASARARASSGSGSGSSSSGSLLLTAAAGATVLWLLGRVWRG